MARWSITVTLGGVDISALLTSEVIVEAEESTSRIATFSIKPVVGTSIDVGDWVGADVTIDYVNDPDGTPVVTRIFTGIVNWPDYNPVTRLVRFDCTDNLQRHFEEMTETEILAEITGGKYSVAVFGEREDGWQQAIDVLSTVSKSYDLDRDGVTATLVDWAAGTPDYSYTAVDIIDNQVTLELTRFRDITNRVSIDYQYRYTRLHHREHTFGWNWGATDFCEYYADTFELPTRDMFNSAAGQAGWAIKSGGGGLSVGPGGIYFETLPDSGSYTCDGGTIFWSISPEYQEQLVTNATWVATKRWTQTVTETQNITVEDASSVSKFGLSLYEDGVGQQEEYDDASFDDSVSTSTPDWDQDAIGDYVLDVVDRVDSEYAIETLIQIAAVRILASHRQNFLGCTVLIEPGIERHHTVSIDAGNVSGVGKIYSYIHRLDINNGSATTVVKAAISKSGVGGSTDIIDAPLPPDTTPVHAAPATNTVLPTRIGLDDTVPDYDETWTGFTGNYSVAHGSPTPEQDYPRRIRIETPDIESEARDEVTASRDTTYNIQCPNETLVING